MTTPKPGPYGVEDNSLRAMGGESGVAELVDRFYDAMQQMPRAARILAMHPQPLDESRAKLTAFLTGWLGGPKRYSERWGSIRIPQAHRHLPITHEDARAWLECMQQAADAMTIHPEFRTYFMQAIAVPAARVVRACESTSSSKSG